MAIESFLEAAGVAMLGNADVYVREYLSFGIDDARELRDRATTRALTDGERVFIVITPVMTVDAQNALLKTLEEPPAGAVFFLVVPSPSTLLPTLRSRVQELPLENGGKILERTVDAKVFLGAAPEKRIDMLKPLYLHDENDERNLSQAIVFLQDLERTLAPRVGEQTVRIGIHALYMARKYLSDKGAVLKPLLEQVALMVPRM